MSKVANMVVGAGGCWRFGLSMVALIARPRPMFAIFYWEVYSQNYEWPSFFSVSVTMVLSPTLFPRTRVLPRIRVLPRR